MPLRAIPEAVLYQGQGDKHYWDIVIKKREFC